MTTGFYAFLICLISANRGLIAETKNAGEMRILLNPFLLTIMIVSLVSCQPDRHKSDSHEGYEVVETIGAKNTEMTQPVVQIFVENSASIDGYVSGGSDLRDVVEGYLYKVRSEIKPLSIECFFINSKKIPIGNDIKKFADQITPAHFKKSGGNRGTSDIADILRQIVPQGEDTISILVSDFIFSPGKQDAENYIKRQYNQINDLFANIVQRKVWSILIYRFDGKFSGTYYDRNDNHSKFEGKRPFYMWVIGRNEYIRRLREIEEKPNIDIRNKCIITNFVDNIDYAIQPNMGDYRICKNSNKAIEKAKLSSGRGSHKGNVKSLIIGINVDFSGLIVNEQYLLDTSNYTVDNPACKVTSVQTCRHPSYTHTIILESTSNNSSEVTVNLRNKMPRWIYRFNDDVGNAANESDSIQTTYGLKKIVGGAFDAFTDKDDNLCSLKISINQ